MSTATKTSLTEATAIATRFRDLFDGCHERWEIAGSVRRKKPEVADVEHVVIPKFVEISVGGLFGEMKRVNALIRRSDELLAAGTIAKHQYGESGVRWGEKYRGCDFAGRMQEIFSADENNWGATLAIRTGSADFSRRLVTGLLANGRRNFEGKVWRCEPCNYTNGHTREGCKKCGGTGLTPIEPISAPDERTYFELCGVKFIEPEMRTA